MGLKTHNRLKVIATVTFFVALLVSPVALALPSDTETDEGTVSLRLDPTAMTVDGCTAPYSLVSIFDNNLPVGSVVADGAGNYSKYVILNKHGLHNAKVYAEDSSGFLTATLTQNFNAKDHFNTFVHTTLSPTVKTEKNVFTSGEKISFIGSSCPNTEITLKIDNVYTISTKTNNQGKWFAVISTVGFAFGEHSYYVSRLDDTGKVVPTQRQLFRVVTSGE